MIYGIDLGTTNSLIGVHGQFLSEIVPSIVNTETGEAGNSQRKNYNTERGFKVGMTTDIAGALPVFASSCVLKELKRTVGLTGAIDAVISVPAYFNNAQRNATVKAAKAADINVKALINEPTAASVIINENKNGVSVVFDLGGGTFDISVIESMNGKHRVLATDGCILGGNNFDAALLSVLAEQVNLGWRLEGDKKALDTVCDAKITMSHPLNNKEDVIVNFVDHGAITKLSFDTYMECMKRTFAKTVTLTNSVLDEAGVDRSSCAFYFVGGSTKSSFLREWVANEVGVVPAPITYDPDRVVAEGACYYAKLVEEGAASEVLSDISKIIGFGLGNGLLEVLVPKNANLPYVGTTTHIASYDTAVEQFTLKFYQGDSIIVDECELLGEMKFKFSEIKEPGDSVFDVDVLVDINGLVTIKCSEILQKPQTLTMEVTK